jgi:hypothetical protein
VTTLPFELSIKRVTWIALAMSAAGVALVLALAGPRDALGFLIGAGLSLVTIRSWFGLAGSLGADGGVPGGRAAIFLVLRYLLIAGAIYATIKGLRSSPAILISGLLVSFLAVVAELGIALLAPKASKS